ncbi:MAG: M56 family metallopeptidase [Phycisphaerae bacterium]
MQPILPILLDAALKGLAILLLAALATAAMRRSSAAARHLVWTTAVVAVLTMPLLAYMLPGLAVLPAPVAGELEKSTAAIASEVVPPAAEGTASQQAASEPPLRSADAVPPPVAADAAPPTAAPDRPAEQVEEQSTGNAATAAAPPTADAPSPAPWWQAWLAWLPWVWLGGAAFALIPLALGWLSLWHLKRTTQPITGGSWQSLLNQLQVEIGLKRPVALLMSPCRTMPMTWGALPGWLPGAWGKARVLIPEDASEWSAERRRAVLLHELAHIQRRDCLTQMLTQIACALYWFNPLVWYAAQRMLVERERACDDLVLTHETKASDYAQHLLDIATGPQARFFAAHAGIAMARRSKLDGRLVAILDQQRNRRALTRLGVALTLTLIGAVAVPVAMLSAERGELTGEHRVLEGDPYDQPMVLNLRSGQMVPESEAIAQNMPYVGIAAHASSQRRGSRFFGLLPAKPSYTGALRLGHVHLFEPPTDQQVAWQRFWTGSDVPTWPASGERQTLFYQWQIESSDAGQTLLFQTHDGARGVVQIGDLDLQRVQLRWRLLESPAAADIPRPVQAEFSDGTVLTILGLGESPSEPNSKWWTPDGTELPRPLYLNASFGAGYEDRMARNLAYHLQPGTDGPRASRSGLRPNSGSGHFAISDEFGERVDGIQHSSYLLPADRDTAELRFGISVGQWQVALETDARGGNVPAEWPTLELSAPQQRNGEVVVEAVQSFDWGKFHTRLVASDAAGRRFQMHDTDIIDIDPDTGTRRHRYEFDSGQAPSRVAGLRFEFRPYEYVLFRNLSLHPGQRTQVEVEYVGIEEEEARLVPVPLELADPPQIDAAEVERLWSWAHQLLAAASSGDSDRVTALLGDSGAAGERMDAQAELIEADVEQGVYRWRVKRHSPSRIVHGMSHQSAEREGTTAPGVPAEPSVEDAVLTLDISLSDGKLVAEMMRQEQEGREGGRTQLADLVPGTELRQRHLANPVRLTDERLQTLWEGEMVKDGEVVQRFAYYVRLLDGTEPFQDFSMDDAREARPFTQPEDSATGEFGR